MPVHRAVAWSVADRLTVCHFTCTPRRCECGDGGAFHLYRVAQYAVAHGTSSCRLGTCFVRIPARVRYMVLIFRLRAHAVAGRYIPDAAAKNYAKITNQLSSWRRWLAAVERPAAARTKIPTSQACRPLRLIDPHPASSRTTPRSDDVRHTRMKTSRTMSHWAPHPPDRTSPPAIHVCTQLA